MVSQGSGSTSNWVQSFEARGSGPRSFFFLLVFFLPGGGDLSFFGVFFLGRGEGVSSFFLSGAILLPGFLDFEHFLGDGQSTQEVIHFAVKSNS